VITQCTIQNLYKTKNNEAIELAKTFERRRCNHGIFEKRKTEEIKSTIDRVEETDNKDENESGSETLDNEFSVNKTPENDIQDKPKNKIENGKDTTSKDSLPFKSAFDCINDIVVVNGANKHRYVVATQKTRLRSRLRRTPAIPLIYINRSVMILEPMSPATEKIRDNIEASKLSEGLNDVEKKRDLEEEDDDRPKKKRKGPKGPNPLSVKKKTKALESEAPSADGQKRRRKRAKRQSEPTEQEHEE
jgi:U3 small nucleolar RNA-associated protein 23